MQLPPLMRVRQHFDRSRLGDVPQAVEEALVSLALQNSIKPGHRVALTGGSRGIANIVSILAQTVRHLRALGADPFIVPSMGSHGGATAEGQEKLLASYGITGATVGAPICASMETVELGQSEFGVPLFIDRLAHEADAIGVIGRVKLHTMFSGPLQSGLSKMVLIGLGKHAGALAWHQAALRYRWSDIVASAVPAILAKSAIRFGLGIVENAYEETASVTGVAPHTWFEQERSLLVDSAKRMPRLPVDQLDLLIIDEIGKNISGAGADTNITGRKHVGMWERDPNEQADIAPPRINRIFVRGLSATTHGNASGIGLADFTHDRLIDQMNYQATLINCLTANHPEAAMIPPHYATDRAVLETALKTTGVADPMNNRIARIRDTLHLGELLISSNCGLQAGQPGLELVGPEPWHFTDDGQLDDDWFK